MRIVDLSRPPGTSELTRLQELQHLQHQHQQQHQQQQLEHHHQPHHHHHPKRYRTLTLSIASTSLLYNILSSVLVHHLPDDPYHLATNVNRYLHFGTCMGVLGVVGVFKNAPLALQIFTNYLLLDTLLSTLLRFFLLSLLNSHSHDLCAQYGSPIRNPLAPSSPLPHLHLLPTEPSTTGVATPVKAGLLQRFTMLGRVRDMPGGVAGVDGKCESLLYMTYLAASSAVLAGMLLQGFGALAVWEYARRLRRGQMAWEGINSRIRSASSRIEMGRLEALLDTKLRWGGGKDVSEKRRDGWV